MAKMFGFVRRGADGSFSVARRASAAVDGTIVARKRQVDPVQAVLDGRSIAPTDVYARRADEILERLRERTR